MHTEPTKMGVSETRGYLIGVLIIKESYCLGGRYYGPSSFVSPRIEQAAHLAMVSECRSHLLPSQKEWQSLKQTRYIMKGRDFP